MLKIKNVNLNTSNSSAEQEQLGEFGFLIAEADAVIEIDAESGSTNSNYETDRTKKNENGKEASKCFKAIGVITKIKGNCGEINNSFIFNINKVAQNVKDLKIGCKVEFWACKEEKDSDLRIYKVSDKISDTTKEIAKPLEEIQKDNPKFFNYTERNVLGTITQRREHFIQVESATESCIEVDLQRTSIRFIPEEGDRVVLQCVVRNDEDYFGSNLDVLECKNVSYLRKKTIKGTVSVILYNYGVIDNEAYFTFDVLDIGYKPSKGDLVFADVIENERNEALNFRCIKVVLSEKAIETPPNDKVLEKNELFENKNGIVVTDKIHFKFDKLDQIDTKYLAVRNNSAYTQEIIRCVFRTSISNSQLRLKNIDEIQSNLKIKSGSSITFEINAKSKRFGLSSEIFELHFNEFVVARSIKIEVGGKAEVSHGNQLNDNKRYGGNSLKQKSNIAKIKWNNMQNRISLRRIFNQSIFNLNVTRPRIIKQRIQMYEVPERLRNAVLDAENREQLSENIESIFFSLREELKPENYSQRFSALLHIEEIERFLQMLHYDCDRAQFQQDGEYLSFNIENLKIRKPALVIGDTVHATNSCAEKGKEQAYQGTIHKILHNRILIKFNSTFHSKYNGEDYRLEFFFSRTSFRKMHHSVHYVQSCLSNEYLFPNKVICKNDLQCKIELNDNDEIVDQASSQIIPWFNPALNHYQKVAVKNVLRGDARPMPYIILGPPGTGKTLTVIESILQLFKNCPDSRLLIGTPTNSLANLIAARLIESNVLVPEAFVRLVGQNIIDKDAIPNHLKPYCVTIDTTFDGTTKDEMIVTDCGLKLSCGSKYLGRYKIIIGTCMTIGTLLYFGYPKNHFSHVIIDEAGQCTEPEIITVIKQVDGKAGQIILAGDPLQLGPLVFQKYAFQKGLATSLLVRLLRTQPYLKDKKRFIHTGYNPVLITKLICNYRSIPNILNGYNDLFYDGELVPMITNKDGTEFTLLSSLENILSKNFKKRATEHGLLFWGVRGKNRQDNDSPSWYNGEEASHVYLFSLKLLKQGVKPKQIGIITPYQKQVKKIHQLFLEADIEEIPKIGSVEKFQGEERDIVLISMVRSSKALAQAYPKHALGFLQSFERMNVAISRARALVVIFGNPHLLFLDSNWQKLIRYCIAKNCYTGCDLPTVFDRKPN